MNLQEKPWFASVLSNVAEVYGKKLSPPLLAIYWHALKIFTLPEIKQALHTHILNPDTGQFMPKPADVVRYLQGSHEAQALQAWSKVTAAIKTVGAYDSIVFDDPLIHLVIEHMQGWIHLCHMPTKQLLFLAHEFSKRYIAMLRHKPRTWPDKLMGIIEQQRAITGDKPASPYLFGDPKLALAVYQNSHKETYSATSNYISVNHSNHIKGK